MPAIIAPPNIAGTRASLIARRGSILANEIDRTTGTLLWIELAPTGQARPRNAALLSALKRPPARLLVLCRWRATKPLRSSGVRRWERILPLMIVEWSYVGGRMTGEKFTPSRGPGLADVLGSVFFFPFFCSTQQECRGRASTKWRWKGTRRSAFAKSERVSRVPKR